MSYVRNRNHFDICVPVFLIISLMINPVTLTAQQQPDQIAQYFEGIYQQLQEYASDPALVALFTAEDEPALQSEAELGAGMFANALKLRLLVEGRYQLDTDGSPPLGFVSLDLLRRAESSDARVNPELLMAGTEDEHVVFIQRVVNDTGELVGLVHLSLAPAIFNEALQDISAGDGYLELQQTAGGQTRVLASAGNQDYKSGDAAIVGIKGTGWRLASWSDRPLFKPDAPVDAEIVADNNGAGLPLVPIGIGVAVLVAVAGLVLLRGRSGGKSAALDDADSGLVYTGAIEAIMNGAHPGMEKLIPNLDSIKRGSIKPLSQGMEGDDITMVGGFRKPGPGKKPAPEISAAETAEDEDVTDPNFKTKKQKQATPAAAPAAPDIPAAKPSAAAAEAVELSPHIFRTYDIRGVVGKDLTPEIVNKIGQSIGSEAAARNEQKVVVGRDGRTSSPELGDALVAGLRAAGRDVVDIGMVPTPVLYFAANTLDTKSGVMLTGSHNGPEYNGLKIVLAGETLSEEAIKSIYTRITENKLETGDGKLEETEVVVDYIRRISEDIPVSLSGAFKLVVDCGNGVAGAVAPQLYRSLGHDVIELYCDVDGKFPNHHPDPSQPENLQDLINKVREEGADLGFAFDGDADRLGVVTSEGNVIWPDRQLMVLAKDVLSRNPGAEIIYDVKCSRHLKNVIEASGGKALMWKTGHSLIKGKMKETGAPLAGEMSGHIFFKERWYGFDDAMYAGARLLEILMNAEKKPSEVFAEIPDTVSTPELRVDLTEEAHKSFMGELKEKMSFAGAEVFDIDGFRIEFPDAWGLVRPSNTTPCLVLRFEADNEEALKRIQGQFTQWLHSVNPELKLPF